MRTFRTLTLAAGIIAAALAGPAKAEFWTAPGNTGIAITSSQSTGNTFVVHYGYRIDGSPTWRIADRNDGGNIHFNGVTFTARDGQPLGGTYRAPTLTEGGSIRATFANVLQGTLQLDSGPTVDLTRTLIEANRPAPSSGGNYIQAGVYWNADEAGTGYAIEVQGDTIFAAVFTYEANGDATWAFTTGSLTRNGNATWSYSGALNRCTSLSTVTCPSIGQIGLTGTNNSARVTLPNGAVTNVVRFNP